MLIGIVGKANVGKSTFFKALTLAEAEIANYPFVTIKPNHGIGYVKVNCPDKEFNTACNPKTGYCIKHFRFVPVELLDVAGLVPGAHLGKGMGFEFLDDLRQADALIHVIDVSGSTNENGEPVNAGTYDPANDIKFLLNELDMWFYHIIKRGWDKFARQMQQEKLEPYKAIAQQLSGLKVTEDMIKECIKSFPDIKEWDDTILKRLASNLRKISKPMIIAANKIDVKGALNNFKRLKEEFPDTIFVPCSAESELALKEAAKQGFIEYVPGSNNFEVTGNLNEKQVKALNFIKEHVLDKLGTTGVQDIINKIVFDVLDYIAVYPVPNSKLTDKDGNILPDCFLIPKGSTVLDFAYRVHTDLGKNFIKAVDIKTKLVISREHELKNNDVIEIISSK